ATRSAAIPRAPAPPQTGARPAPGAVAPPRDSATCSTSAETDGPDRWPAASTPGKSRGGTARADGLAPRQLGPANRAVRSLRAATPAELLPSSTDIDRPSAGGPSG